MNGILLVNKEANMTSHDVVNRVRRILHTKKVGHTGTLDPNATGVLVLLIGNATKLLPFLENTDKVYVAGLELGYSTISEDIWMDKVEEKDGRKEYTISAEVFGDGVDMWLRSQGDSVKIVK